MPDFVQVAKTIKDVSVDVVILNGAKVRYIEFHEKQHRNLSVNRQTPIFIDSSKDSSILIPRYAQRFLKDIWRYENLNNYQIVWWDWFEHNKLKGIDALFENERATKEFSFAGKFNFSDFLKED